MTVGEVKSRYDDIVHVAETGDGETAHLMEDELHLDVLKAIAEGRCEEPRECARIAVATEDLDIERHYS